MLPLPICECNFNMLKKINNIIQSCCNQSQLRQTSLSWCLFLAIALGLTIDSNTGVVLAQTVPQSLRSDIKIRNVLNTLTTSASIRIAKDPRNQTLYYLKQNGDIYRVNLGTTSTAIRVYTSTDHKAVGVQGMAIGPDGTIYLVGNADVGNVQTRATIVKGVLNSTGGRVWSTLAQTASYPRSATAYDHRFNGAIIDPTNTYLYVNSGSRTDHGEVQSANNLYPNTREVGLTACILRLPIGGQNILLPNDRNSLKTSGYIFAEGTRNTFDFAFAPNNDLFGAENGPDRDMPDELNWLRQGGHYGFPWRIGGLDNPQQYSNYNPASDRLLDPKFNAVKLGYYYNDPTFPRRPSIDLFGSIYNLGPDADSFRDSVDGQVKDASNLGLTIRTFTAHRSPLGLVFDRQNAMSTEFQGDGFMLSWTKGDPTGATVAGPFKDPSEDLLHLDLAKVTINNNLTYQVRTKRIVQGFNQPIDAEIIGNKIYVLEYGGNQGIWEVSLPART